MENNRYLVYTDAGFYLGLCDLRLGNDVMIIPDVDNNSALMCYVTDHPSCTLHLDNQSTSQALSAIVGQPYKGRDNEFTIQLGPKRDAHYPRPRVDKWYYHLPGWAQLKCLLEKEPL